MIFPGKFLTINQSINQVNYKFVQIVFFWILMFIFSFWNLKLISIKNLLVCSLSHPLSRSNWLTISLWWWWWSNNNLIWLNYSKIICLKSLCLKFFFRFFSSYQNWHFGFRYGCWISWQNLVLLPLLIESRHNSTFFSFLPMLLHSTWRQEC